MKKLSMMMLLVVLFVISGCGKTVTTDGMNIEKRDFGEITPAKQKSTESETVVCSTVSEETNVTMNQDIKLYFKSGNLKSADIVIDAVLDDDYLSYIDSFVTSLKTQFANFQYSDNVEVKKTSKGARVTYSMDEDDFESQYGSGVTKSAIVKEMEAAGYDCD